MNLTSTLTRADISEEIYREAGISRHESAILVDQILDLISDALVTEEIVKISSFGRFSVRFKKERIGRNPKTGKEVPICPRRVLMFRASQTLKERIDAGMSSKKN